MVSRLNDEIEYLSGEIQRTNNIKAEVKENLFTLQHKYALLKEEYKVLSQKVEAQKQNHQKFQSQINHLEQLQGIDNAHQDIQRQQNLKEQALQLIALRPSQYVDLLQNEVERLAESIIEKEAEIKNIMKEDKIKYVTVSFEGRKVSVRNTDHNQTFHDLQADAAKYFALSASHCILKDQYDTFWPPDAKVRSSLLQESNLEFVLYKKFEQSTQFQTDSLFSSSAKNKSDAVQKLVLSAQQEQLDNERTQNMLNKKKQASLFISAKIIEDLLEYSSDEDGAYVVKDKTAIANNSSSKQKTNENVPINNNVNNMDAKDAQINTNIDNIDTKDAKDIQLQKDRLQQRLRRQLRPAESDAELQAKPLNVSVILGRLGIVIFYAVLIFLSLQNKRQFHPYYQDVTYSTLFQEATVYDSMQSVTISQNTVNNYYQVYLWVHQILIPALFSPAQPHYDYQSSLNVSDLDSLIQSIYDQEQARIYKATVNQNRTFVAQYNQLLGPVRLVSHRMSNNTCQIIDLTKRIKIALKNTDISCYGPYVTGDQETSPFGQFNKYQAICDFSNFTQETIQQRKVVNGLYVQDGVDINMTIAEAKAYCYNIRPFQYQAQIPNAYAFNGILSDYDASGYMADLECNPDNLTSMVNFFNYLQNMQFLDLQSRSFFLFANLYNVNLDAYSEVRVGFEIDASGLFVVSNKFNTIEVDFLAGWTGMFSNFFHFAIKVCEAYVLLYTLIFLIPKIYKKLRRTKWQFFLNFFSLIELVLILSIISVSVLKVYQELQISSFKADITNLNKRGFVRLSPVMTNYWRISILEAFIVFIILCNFIQLIKLGKLQLVFLTLEYSFLQLIVFLFLFSIVFVAFSIVGSRFYGFRSYQVSAYTLFQLITGDTDILQSMLTVSFAISILYTLIFLLFIVFIFLNLLSAILIESYLGNQHALKDANLQEGLNNTRFARRLRHEYVYFFHIFKRKIRRAKNFLFGKSKARVGGLTKYQQEQRDLQEQIKNQNIDRYRRDRNAVAEEDPETLVKNQNLKFPNQQIFDNVNYDIKVRD